KRPTDVEEHGLRCHRHSPGPVLAQPKSMPAGDQGLRSEKRRQTPRTTATVSSNLDGAADALDTSWVARHAFGPRILAEMLARSVFPHVGLITFPRALAVRPAV